MTPSPGLWRAAFPITKQNADLVTTLLEETTEPLSVSAAGGTTENWFAEALYTEQPSAEALVERLSSSLPGLEARDISISLLEDRDWVAETQANLHPIVAGRFVVHGSHDRGRLPKGLIPIEIEAAQAFGTGHHATTAACLEALTWLHRRARPAHILDLGTGSGVLAIAAAKLWRTQIIATDIDPIATAIAAQNARENEAAPFIETLTATGMTAPRIHSAGGFDLICANILARPLMVLAGPMLDAAKPGAYLILSGLLTRQEQAVLSRYRARSTQLIKTFRQDEWSALVLRA